MGKNSFITSIVNQKILPIIPPVPPVVGTGFTTQWATTASNETITLPILNFGGEVFDATVDWGDGSEIQTITSYDDTNRIHEYADAGTYDVEIKGQLPNWSFSSVNTSRLNFRKIIHWGEASEFDGFKYINGAFANCTNLNNVGLGKILVKSGEYLNSIGNIFDGCSSITSIPAGLFDNVLGVDNTTNYSVFRGTAITSIPSGIFSSITGGSSTLNFDYMCQGCSSLETIPENLFEAFGSKLINTSNSYFRDCSSLTAIPEALFHTNTELTSMSRMFDGCSSITEIPAGLFSANTKVVSFNSCFLDCTGINTPIPAGLFSAVTVINTTGAWQIFDGCINMTGAIPAGLFDKFTNNTNGYNATFKDCRKITSVPTDLFRYSTTVTGNRSFYETFSNCYLLASIPTDLFRYNTLVGGATDLNGDCFYRTFSLCSQLTSIPETLFSYNTDVRGFRSTLSSCGLTSIPAGLFSANTEVTKFEYTLSGAQQQYTSIPATLFANNSKVTSMQSVFSASDITSIPTTLFDSLTGCTTFNSNFNGCDSLTIAPAGLYDECVSALAITSEFATSTGLNTVETDIFRYNVNVTNFTGVFSNCNSLVNVPSGLFKYNTACLNFTSIFQGSSNFALIPDIFDDDGTSGSTRFLNQSVDFDGSFSDTAYVGLAGTAPELWWYDFGTGTPSSTGTFNGRTELTNYADIPTAWGGA